MITSSLHNHCTFCDGADSLEAMAKAAFEAGIEDFGISCHSFVDFDRDCCVESEDKYIAAVRNFISHNPYPMNLYLGAEEDALGEVKRREEYDYLIGSVHYLKQGEIFPIDESREGLLRCLEEGFGGNAFALLEAYFENVVKEARRGVEIIGHFDLIRKFGGVFDFESARYREIAFAALDECLAKDAIIELNYGGIQRGYLSTPYPDKPILKRIAEKRGRVIVSTDCHAVKGIAFGLKEAPLYLRSFGFREVTVMKNGKFTAQKI